jgi:hypothetical protein
MIQFLYTISVSKLRNAINVSVSKFRKSTMLLLMMVVN